MNAVQQTRKKQLVRVNEAYKQDQTDYDSIPALVTAFARLAAIDQEIDSCTQKQITVTVGTTKTKNELKETLANRGYLVAGAVYSWATDTNNAAVQAQASYTEVVLLKLNDIIIGPTCRNIYDLAIANADGLKSYIDAAIVQQLLEAITAYTAINGKPLKQIKDRGTETKKLASLFTEVNKIYKNKTNKLVEQLKDKFPITYNNYQTAIELPQSGDSPKGNNPTPTPPAE